MVLRITIHDSLSVSGLPGGAGHRSPILLSLFPRIFSDRGNMYADLFEPLSNTQKLVLWFLSPARVRICKILGFNIL